MCEPPDTATEPRNIERADLVHEHARSAAGKFHLRPERRGHRLCRRRGDYDRREGREFVRLDELSYTEPARRPWLPAHAKKVAFGASRKVRRQLTDDGANYRTARTRLVDGDDRLVGVRDPALPRALERQANRLLEALRPEIRRHARDRARDLAFIAGVDRKRNEAEARVADGDVVDVELELGSQGDRFAASHLSSLATSAAIARASFRVPRPARRGPRSRNDIS